MAKRCNAQGKIIEESDHGIRVNAFLCHEPVCPAMAVNHGETVKPRSALGRDMNVFFGELPTAWHVCLLTNMGLISAIKVYGTFAPQPFKLLQLPKLVSVELRRGFALWTFPYSPNLAPMRLKNA